MTSIARQLFTRKLCRELTVLELFDAKELTGDAATNRQMLATCGCPVVRILSGEARRATIVVDAILGTGLSGPVKEGATLDGISLINREFSLAKKVAIDIASGFPSEKTKPTGEFVIADYTVTFVAPKIGNIGKFVVGEIGTPADLCEKNENFRLN